MNDVKFGYMQETRILNKNSQKLTQLLKIAKFA
jgi:hypothetical protein